MPMPLCICQNCAEECHEALGHEVEFYGQGPSYCDCSSFHEDRGVEGCSCVLHAKSREAARKLGIIQNNANANTNAKKGDGDDQLGVNYALEKKTARENDFPFEYSVLTIPSLLPNESSGGGSHPCDGLIDQALEFIQHSRDTHWIPHNASTYSNLDDMCHLEQLAYSIFQRHVNAYGLNDKLGIDGGAEWWVQVKKVAAANGQEINEAIDLHYDKDEELAAAFDLGSFPTLSTVTYLTSSILEDGSDGAEKICAAPTVVFPHTYEMPGEGPIGGDDDDDDELEEGLKGLKPASSPSPSSSPSPQIIISHARTGKHLVFDGQLLHGAPSNPLLRQNPDMIGDDENASIVHKGIRVTFLVNIWLTRRPSKVTVLTSNIREKIMTSVVNHPASLWSTESPLEMVERSAASLHFKESEMGASERIHLPFVSSGATWIETDDTSAEDESESGLVLSMLAPQAYEEDTALITYDTGLGPLLEYVGGEIDDEDDDESAEE